jgi:hypothetical protein
MSSLAFRFDDLHADADELPSDIDWIYRFVAGRFAVLVEGNLLFEEVEFPVLELVGALDQWLTFDLPNGRSFDYEVSGGSAGTLTFQPVRSRWLVDSVHRSSDVNRPRPLDGEDLAAGVRSFISEVAQAVEGREGYDVYGLLARLRNGTTR